MNTRELVLSVTLGLVRVTRGGGEGCEMVILRCCSSRGRRYGGTPQSLESRLPLIETLQKEQIYPPSVLAWLSTLLLMN